MLLAGVQVTAFVPDTTLLCIDCQYPHLAARALRLSLEQCGYPSVKFLTDDAASASKLDSRIEFVRIPRIRSAAEYSHFVLKELVRHVDTDFVQIVQWDGYVVNGGGWSESFQDYDYVGARWFFREEGRNVGNGGFSLRSLRLLHALQDPEIRADGPEDGIICITHRALLEGEYGIRFAPSSVADRYSFEGAPPTFAEFGFHRVFNFAYLYDAVTLAELLTNVPEAILHSDGMVTFVEILMHLNRELEALSYARRIRSGDARVPCLSPQVREKLDSIIKDLVSRLGAVDIDGWQAEDGASNRALGVEGNSP